MKHIFHDLFDNAKDKQIMVTTISSNITRMYQITEAELNQVEKWFWGEDQ